MAHKLGYTGKRAADEAVKVINDVKRWRKELQMCFEEWEKLQQGPDDCRDPWIHPHLKSAHKNTEKKLTKLIERGTHDANTIREQQRVRDHVMELKTKLGSKIELLKQLQKTVTEEHRSDDGRPLPEIIAVCIQQNASDNLQTGNICKRARAHDSIKGSTTEGLEVQKHDSWAGQAIKRLSEQLEEFEVESDGLPQGSPEKDVLALKIEKHQWHIKHMELLRRRLHQRTLEFCDAFSKTQQYVDEYVANAPSSSAESFVRDFYYDSEVYECLGQPDQTCEDDSKQEHSGITSEDRVHRAGEQRTAREDVQQKCKTAKASSSSMSGEVPEARGRSIAPAVLCSRRPRSRVRYQSRSGSPDDRQKAEPTQQDLASDQKGDTSKHRAQSIAETARRGRDQEQVLPIDRLARSESRANCRLVSSQEGHANQASTALNSRGYPLRPGVTKCSFYMKTGRCYYCAKCRYDHPEPERIHPDVAATGSSKQAAELPTPSAPQVPSTENQGHTILNRKGYPLRPGIAKCSFYMKTGWCLYRAKCVFDHPESGNLGSDMPPAQASVCQDSFDRLKQSIIQLLDRFDKGIADGRLMLELMKVEPSALQHMAKCGYKKLKPLLSAMPDVVSMSERRGLTWVTALVGQKPLVPQPSERAMGMANALHDAFDALERCVSKVLLKHGTPKGIEAGVFMNMLVKEDLDVPDHMSKCGFSKLGDMLASMPNVANLVHDGSRMSVHVKQSSERAMKMENAPQDALEVLERCVAKVLLKYGTPKGIEAGVFMNMLVKEDPDVPHHMSKCGFSKLGDMLTSMPNAASIVHDGSQMSVHVKKSSERSMRIENTPQDAFEILERCVAKVLLMHGTPNGIEAGTFMVLLVKEDPDVPHHMSKCGFSKLKDMLANMPNAANIMHDGSQMLVSVKLNEFGLPSRPGLLECSYYMKTKRCNYGAACKWHHPDRVAGRGLPQKLASAQTPVARREDKSSNMSAKKNEWPVHLLPGSNEDTDSRGEVILQVFCLCDVDQDGALCADELLAFAKLLVEDVDIENWASTYDFLLHEVGGQHAFDLSLFAKLLNDPGSGLNCTNEKLQMALEALSKSKGQDILKTVQEHSPEGHNIGRAILKSLKVDGQKDSSEPHDMCDTQIWGKTKHVQTTPRQHHSPKTDSGQGDRQFPTWPTGETICKQAVTPEIESSSWPALTSLHSTGASLHPVSQVRKDVETQSETKQPESEMNNVSQNKKTMLLEDASRAQAPIKGLTPSSSTPSVAPVLSDLSLPLPRPLPAHPPPAFPPPAKRFPDEDAVTASEGPAPPPPAFPPPRPPENLVASDAQDASFAQDGSVMMSWITRAPDEWPPNQPVDGYECTLRILNVKDESGNFLMTKRHTAVKTFICGNGEVCDVLESICFSMHRGDVVIARCPASHVKACPSCKCGAQIGNPSKALGLIVELVACQRSTLEEMTPEAQIGFFQSRKDVANNLFKQDRVLLARRIYHGVASLLIQGTPLSLASGAVELRKACLLNVAACALRLHDYAQAKGFCQAALQLEPCSTKGLYRLALAEFELQDFRACISHIRKYMDLDGNSTAGQQLLQRASTAQREADKCSQPMFAKMFQTFEGCEKKSMEKTTNHALSAEDTELPGCACQEHDDPLPGKGDPQGLDADCTQLAECQSTPAPAGASSEVYRHMPCANTVAVEEVQNSEFESAAKLGKDFTGEQADIGAPGKAGSACSVPLDDDCSEQSERSPASNNLMQQLHEVIGWKEQHLLSHAQFEEVKERVLFKRSAIPEHFRQLITWKTEGLLNSEQFEAAKDGLLAESVSWELRGSIKHQSSLPDSESATAMPKPSLSGDTSTASEPTDEAASLVCQLGGLATDATLEEVESTIAAVDAFKGTWGKLKSKKNKLLRTWRKRQQELSKVNLQNKISSRLILAGWTNLCEFVNKLQGLYVELDTVAQPSQIAARDAFLDFQRALDVLRSSMTADHQALDSAIIQNRNNSQKAALQQVEKWHSSTSKVLSDFECIQPEFSHMSELLLNQALISSLNVDFEGHDIQVSKLLQTANTHMSMVDITALNEGHNHVVNQTPSVDGEAAHAGNEIVCLVNWLCCDLFTEERQDHAATPRPMLQELRCSLQLCIKALRRAQYLHLELAESIKEAELRQNALPSITPDKALQDMSEAQQELRSLRRKLKESKRSWEDAKDKLEDGDDDALEEVIKADKEVQASRQQVQKQEQASANVMSQLWQMQEAHFPELLPTLEEKVTSQVIKDALQTLKAADRTKVNAMLLTDRKVEYYDHLEELGGRHEVFRGTYDGQACVIKKLPLTIQQGSKAFIRELRWLTKFSHAESRYTVPLRGFFVDGKCGYLHFDEYPSDLEAWICNHVGMDRLDLLRVSSGVIAAVSYIHSVNFVHGDLKPKNVLMDCDAQPRLCDFEFGRELRGSISAPMGVTSVALVGWSEGFVAPELCQGSIRDPHKLATLESDMFSLGRTLQHLLDIAKSAGDFTALQDLIKRMLQEDPASRITAKGAADAPVFSELFHKPCATAGVGEKLLTQSMNLSPPNYWSSQRLGVPFHIMPSSKYMEEHIQRAFFGTDHCNKLGEAQVVGVKRIETQWLWLSYAAKRERMRDKLRQQGGASPLKPPNPPPLSMIDPEVNEVFLWHGCPADVVHLIAKDGFDERLAYRKCLYGSGVYFTPQACKAMQYARAAGCTYQTKKCGTKYCTCPGRKHLLYSRVCLGNPFYVEGPSRGLQRPPPQPGSSDLSDSVVANPGVQINDTKKQEHREIVIWNHAGMQAYAEFVVEIEFPA